MNNFDLKKYLREGKLYENEDTSSKKQQLVQLLSFPSNFDTKLMQAAKIAMGLRFEDDFDYEKLSQDLESIAESYDFHDLSNQLEDWASSIPMGGGSKTGLRERKLRENEDTSSKKQQLVQLLSFPSNFDTKLMQAAKIAMGLRFEDDFDYEKLSQDLESIAESYDFHDLSNQLEDWASSIPMGGGSKTGLRERELRENEMDSDIVSFLQSNKNELLQTLASKFNWGEDDMKEYSGMDIEMADEGVAGLGEGGLDFSFDEGKVADEFGDASTFKIKVAGKLIYGLSYNF